MRTAFLTYDAPHLKTEQVLLRRYDNAHRSAKSDDLLVILPFSKRPERKIFFPHRPNQAAAAHPEDIARHMRMEVIRVESSEAVPKGMNRYVVLGAGLLPDELVERQSVLNAHPGLIPECRGLDSFKWALLEGKRIGVTLHRLSPEIDMGEVLFRQETPLFSSDTLEAFARRHYENEIELLAHFERFLGEPWPADPAVAGAATRRMSYEEERDLSSCFERYKVERLGELDYPNRKT